MTDKEKLEMLNLRNRVSNQREQIKKLTEQSERLRDYIKNLEMIIEPITEWSPTVRTLYETVKATG